MDKLEPFKDKAEEMSFQMWYSNHAKKLKLNPDPDDPKHFYDYRAAYKSGAGPDEKTKHWPSEYKLEGHPRTIINGINTKTGEKATSEDLKKYHGGIEE